MGLVIPLTSTTWRCQWSQGVPLHPEAVNGGGLQTPVPLKTNGWLGYVDSHAPQDISSYRSMRMAGKIIASANARFEAFNGGDVRLRLFFQRQGDDGTAVDETYRWWSILIHVPCVPGLFDITVPLDGPNWIDVMGHHGDDRAYGFLWAKRHMANIGFTCGGNLLGHGIYLLPATPTPSARIVWNLFRLD